MFSDDTKSIKGSQAGDDNRTKESQNARSSIARVSPSPKAGTGGGPSTPQIGANLPQMNHIEDHLLSTTH